MKIAAIADIHCRRPGDRLLKPIFEQIRQEADVLIMAGDLTDTGLPEEAEQLVNELNGFSIPILAVLGNHDHESGQAEELTQIFKSAGIYMLQATGHEIDGVGFVGTKGFCGGFDKTLIQPFGEDALKTFIKTSIDEAIQLENALARMDCKNRVAILHYAPVKGTLEGEPLELYPFLGSSRLANALDRQGVDLIVHGHAHHGSPYSTTAGNIPVHNVSRFVQSQHTNKAYCLFDL